MSVIATINVGRNGATSKGGSSAALSSDVDRAAFLALHRSAGAYVLGHNSFDAESYQSAVVPIYILTRTPSEKVYLNPLVTEVDVAEGLSVAMRKIKAATPTLVIVEAGVGLLIPLIEAGCVEELHITVSPIDGDNHYIDTEKLLRDFEIINDEVMQSTRLLKCRYQGHSAYREDNS